jgi:hypothetical protein
LLDLRGELLGGWHARQVHLGLGIVTFGDALPPVERYLGETRVGEYPDPLGVDGVRPVLTGPQVYALADATDAVIFIGFRLR